MNGDGKIESILNECNLSDDEIEQIRQDHYDWALTAWGANAPFPLMPTQSEAAVFPTQCLGELSAVIEIIASGVQVSEALAAQSVLSAVSLAVQSRATVQTHLGAICPLSLFTLTVVESGSRKSDVDRIVYRPIVSFEDKSQEKTEAEISMSEKSGATLSASEIEELYARNKHIIEDVSVDNLSDAIVSGQSSLLYVGHDVTQFIGRTGSKSQGKSVPGSYFGKLWSKSRISIKKGRKSIITRDCGLTLNLIAEAGLAGNIINCENLSHSQGLLSKFIATYPISMVGLRTDKSFSPEESSELKTFNNRVTDLLNINATIDVVEDRKRPLKILKIDPAAEASFLKFVGDVERESVDGGSFYQIRHFAANAADHILKLAGLITIYENDQADIIADHYIIWAEHLFLYYASEYKKIIENSHRTEELNKAQKLLNWLKAEAIKNMDEVIGYRYILQRTHDEFRTTKVLDHYLKILAEHKCIMLLEHRKQIRVRNEPEAHSPLIQ